MKPVSRHGLGSGISRSLHPVESSDRGRNKFLDKPLLVTGATGFIGACLTRRLVKEGAEVHILTRQHSNKWRIHDIIHDVWEHHVDLRESKRLQKIISEIKPKVIFHCATYGGYPFQQETDKIVETNIIGTVNLVNALSAIDYECFINTGSSSEYGLKSKPMSEDDLLEALTAYGASKAAATLFCQAVARSTQRPIITLRLFSPYGPYEEPTRLIPYVIKCCLSGENPQLTSGEQTRDFVFIEDVIDLYLRVAASPPHPGEIVNVGSGNQWSVREVVEKIMALCGAKVQPLWGATPSRPFETTVWVADISKAKAILNWVPQTSLDEGLSRTITWHRSWISEHKVI
ncbi:hypothetical protein HKBW3C_01898 [Candidatus Hakubella thermalkaliphila]|nr:hypothetical protein HKBW3C_01898 [Candidatus Hakubella thermalkaliphila]